MRRRHQLIMSAAVAAAVVLVNRVGVVPHGDDTTGPYALLDAGVAYRCAPIHYVVSEPDAPDDFAEVVHGAVGKVSAASGYRFFFDGTTQDRGFDAHLSGDLSGPVLIGFAPTTANRQFEDGAIGLGRSVPGWDGHYATGMIELDATKYADQHDMAERQAIVMHELGHVLGLDHVHDDGELMNERNIGRTSFGPGDLAGLRKLYELSCAGPTSS